MEQNYDMAKEKLVSFMDMATKEDVAVAFSGGVDSTLVLKYALEAAKKNDSKVYAYCIHTTLHPMGELSHAREVATNMGAIFEEVIVDEFREAGIENNPVDRCYRCKKYMFSNVKKRAEKMGVLTIFDGTNEDDLHVYRPGIRALKELGVKSPLAECGFTKEMVRGLLKEHGMEEAKKPSAPCLATRFAYGTKLEEAELERVDKAEQYLKSLGLSNVRVRVNYSEKSVWKISSAGDFARGIARIEVNFEEEELIFEHRQEIIRKFKELGYEYVTLDLAGYRSGSMDEHIKK